MDPNYPDGLYALLGGGIIAFVISLLFSAGAIALSIWITYTIIWRAVRRGLREFYHPRGTPTGSTAGQRQPGPRDW